MPTYEYECDSCGKRFETFQSMSEAPLSVCPSCGQRIKRLINGGTGVIFKGSGFYVNDSKKKSEPAAQKSSCQSCPSSPSCETAKKETA